MVLMLVAPGGRVSASVFVASWALSLGAVATVALLLADGAGARQDGALADWVIAVQIGLAVLLLLVAAWQWRGREAGRAEPDLPGWMQKVDGLTTPRAAAMAVRAMLRAAMPIAAVDEDDNAISPKDNVGPAVQRLHGTGVLSEAKATPVE